MSVPTVITDLSATAGLNPPAGSESVVAGDDHLRAHAAFIRQLYDSLTSALANLVVSGNATLGDSATDTLNVGAGGLIKDASGNVGIGGSPTSRLHVKVAVDNSYAQRISAATGTMRLSGYVGGGAYIDSVNLAESGFLPLVFNSSGMQFEVVDTVAMIIDSSRNVGIGRTSTAGKLEVQGDINAVETGASDNFVSANITSVGAALLGVNNSGSTNAYGAPTATSYVASSLLPLVFGVGAAESMRIDTSGNVIPKVTATPPTLSTNLQMAFNLTSNTNLRISVRGTDGVTRVTNLTLA